MAIIDLTMPKLGESIMEATILRWHKKPGDQVKVDETILEIATDKVDSEVPSIVQGEIAEILFQENDVVPVGAVIARINTAGAGAENSEDDASLWTAEDEDMDEGAQGTGETPTTDEASQPAESVPVESGESTGGAGRFYSPLVMTIARNEGVSMQELEQVPGTGMEGRVTKKDILAYVAAKKHRPAQAQEAQAVEELPEPQGRQLAPTPPELRWSGNVEIIEMDRMRRLIAEHMIHSKQTSAHVTSFAEADVTHMVQWRDRVKKDFEKREGEKLTFTPLFVEAVVRCIKKFPMINSSVDGTRIMVKKDINIGMATALPNGNLIVPVIRHADTLNLVGLAKRVNYLAQAGRNGRLVPEDTQDGTFTLTNVGTFGSLMGTPIINQPQVAILAVGAIKKRPVVVETSQGDSIAIRHMMYLSLSYDHRIIDGSLGSTFLAAVAHELEQFDPERDL